MRVSTGVPGFDRLVDDGLPANRLYVLSGPPGSGKTTFSAHFVTEGAKQGETCLYLTMHETRAELADDLGSYEFGFDRALSTDRVQFMNAFDSETKRLLSSPGQNDFSSSVQTLTNRLVNFIEANGISRVVIDSTMLLEYFYPSSTGTYMQFLTSLKQVDATTLVISEMTDPTSYADEHYLAHGVVFLHNYLEASGMTRGVQIIKMRGTQIDSDIREVAFSDRGLQVDPKTKVQV